MLIILSKKLSNKTKINIIGCLSADFFIIKTNIMTKKINTVLLLFLTVFAFSQKTLSPDYDYQVSDPYRVVDARVKEYFSNGKEVLGVKVKAKSTEKYQVLLQKYNVDGMKEIGKKGYNDFPKNFLFEGIVQAQDKFYFFYSSWTGKKTKHERLFVREVNFEEGTFKDEGKQIVDHDGYLVNFFNNDFGFGGIVIGFGPMISFGGTTKFDLMTSEDESKILIQYRKKPKVRKDTKSWDIINVEVYDLDMNKSWEKQYTMPYTERRMNFLDNMVDNDGNIFMVAKVFHDDSNKDKKKRKDKQANYHIELFELNSSLDKIKTSKISLDDKFINGISLFQSGNKDIICAGYYNKGKSLGSADGIFTYKINQKGVLVDKYYYEIPIEILNLYVKNRTKKKNLKKDKKGKAEAGSLNLKELIYADDGSLTLIGEVVYTIYHYSKTGGYYTFHYEDILVTKINADGEFSWMKKIPKRQRGTKGKGGMSYTYFNTNGNHYLIYLDNVKNFDLPIDKIPALHMDGKGGYLTAVKINNETGDLVKGSILDFRKIKGEIVAYQFNTDRIVKIKDNAFFVEVYKKKKEDIFLKVEIKK